MCDLAQQVVAGVVAEGVVDRLEAVEVEEQDGAVAVRAGEGGLDALDERRAVGQPGQRVGERAGLQNS